MPSGIDERLLAAANSDRERQEEMTRADQLRQQQLAAKDKNRQTEMSDEDTFRQGVAASRIAEASAQASAIVGLPTKPSGIRRTLSIGWSLMAGVYTFIFGVILADIHWAGNRLLGKKFFCDLGDELPGAQLINAAPFAKKNKETGEKMLLAITNAIAFVAIIFMVSILVWLNDNLVFRVIYKAGQIVSSGYQFIGGQ